MRAALGDVDATIPVQALQTMDASMLDVVAEPRFKRGCSQTFSLLALLLAVIGTYGVLAYDVAERTREIGIRIALGAGTRDVRRLVIGRTLVFATVGIVLGSVGALAATRLLSRFLFGVTSDRPGDIRRHGDRPGRRGARRGRRPGPARDARGPDSGLEAGLAAWVVPGGARKELEGCGKASIFESSFRSP
jgi:ABC-type antimicrobial peptide transport system permease subunit